MEYQTGISKGTLGEIIPQTCVNDIGLSISAYPTEPVKKINFYSTPAKTSTNSTYALGIYDINAECADKLPTSTMLTVREVSRLLHVHSNTLRRWNDLGVIKAYRIGPRGDRRFKPEDIAALLLEEVKDSPPTV